MDNVQKVNNRVLEDTVLLSSGTKSKPRKQAASQLLPGYTVSTPSNNSNNDIFCHNNLKSCIQKYVLKISVAKHI